jgi:hypothetical protein
MCLEYNLCAKENKLGINLRGVYYIRAISRTFMRNWTYLVQLGEMLYTCRKFLFICSISQYIIGIYIAAAKTTNFIYLQYISIYYRYDNFVGVTFATIYIEI